MSTKQLDGVSVNTQASVYFDGKCVSHGVTFADGTKKSVGVVLPATTMTGQSNDKPMRWATVRTRSSPISMLVGCRRSQCANQSSNVRDSVLIGPGLSPSHAA